MLGSESRYMRTSWMLDASESLQISQDISIRKLDDIEANKLKLSARSRNVFARHSWENNFYIQRLEALSGKTIIELYLPGDPNSIAHRAVEIARILETCVLLSSVFAIKRKQLHIKLGLTQQRESEIDFIIGPQMQYLKSRSHIKKETSGLKIDKRFVNRFFSSGFDALFQLLLKEIEISSRLNSSFKWLLESRLETNLHAAFVKTSIALETLLIFDENESLARSLSERMAFLLAKDIMIRKYVSKLIKSFYNARSGIVHGSKKKTKEVKSNLLECIDRMIMMAYLIIGNNEILFPNTNTLNNWFENQRWGSPSESLVIPFRSIYLSNAMKLAEVNSNMASTHNIKMQPTGIADSSA